MYQYALAQRRAGGMAPRRFDEYFRCYPVAMMPGPERESANHGGKIFLPPSALDKLTRMHITYPMLFELINGAKEKVTHAGVLEFIAEEGKVYLPYWVRHVSSPQRDTLGTHDAMITTDKHTFTSSWKPSSSLPATSSK